MKNIYEGENIILKKDKRFVLKEKSSGDDWGSTILYLCNLFMRGKICKY